MKKFEPNWNSALAAVQLDSEVVDNSFLSSSAHRNRLVRLFESVPVRLSLLNFLHTRLRRQASVQNQIPEAPRDRQNRCLEIRDVDHFLLSCKRPRVLLLLQLLWHDIHASNYCRRFHKLYGQHQNRERLVCHFLHKLHYEEFAHPAVLRGIH